MTTDRTQAFEAGRKLFRTTAFAIKVGDQYFAGFGNEKDGSPRTKLRHGLCEATLISGSAPQKVDEYILRLQRRGLQGTKVRITIEAQEA